MAGMGRLAGTPCSIPFALISSSMSGQWTPSPLPMILNFLRCAEVASDRRQDHASGTLMVRPSASCALMVSSVTSNETIRGSLTTAMLIPCLHNVVQAIHNNFSNAVQLFGGEAVIICQAHGLKPEFTHVSLSSHMHVPWLVTIEAVKVQSVGPGYARNSRHALSIYLFLFQAAHSNIHSFGDAHIVLSTDKLLRHGNPAHRFCIQFPCLGCGLRAGSLISLLTRRVDLRVT
jgi:hypothetical protein